jgi:hypothetical protein
LDGINIKGIGRAARVDLEPEPIAIGLVVQAQAGKWDGVLHPLIRRQRRQCMEGRGVSIGDAAHLDYLPAASATIDPEADISVK